MPTSNTYPVSFEADYIESRNRLTVFLRFILSIPILLWVGIYGIAASIAIMVAWLAIVFTGQYPEGLYNFVAGFLRLTVRATAYSFLLVDPYPAFNGNDDPAYPVRMQFERLSEYSRLKTLIRIILAIPIMVLRYVVTLLMELGAFAAWIVCVVTGKMPRGLFDMLVTANSYIARSDAYLYLLTETYPPFEA
jgi:hypothetical protein